jgi:DNA-binding Xre family transcriptional regulator
MMIRGLMGADLMQTSGVSEPTISHCLNGRRLSPPTMRKICVALSRTPALDLADDLVA